MLCRGVGIIFIQYFRLIIHYTSTKKQCDHLCSGNLYRMDRSQMRTSRRQKVAESLRFSLWQSVADIPTNWAMTVATDIGIQVKNLGSLSKCILQPKANLIKWASAGGGNTVTGRGLLYRCIFWIPSLQNSMNQGFNKEAYKSDTK